MILPFKNNFRRKLVIVFTLLLVSVLLLALKTYQNNRAHQKAQALESNTRDILRQCKEVQTEIKTFEAAIKDYVITTDTSLLPRIEFSKKNVLKELAYLRGIACCDRKQKQSIDSLAGLIGYKVAFAEAVFASRKQNGFAGSKQLIKADVMVGWKPIDNLVNRLLDEEDHILDLQKRENERSNNAFLLFLFLLTASLVIIIILAFVFIWHSFKARWKAEVRLLKNKALLQSIIDNTSSVIYVKDLDGNYVLTNKQFEQVNQLPRGTSVGKRDNDIFLPPVAAHFRAIDAKIMAGNELVEIEETIEIQNKLQTYYSVKFPITNYRGEVYAVGGVCANITGLIKKQELQRQKAIAHNIINTQEKERKHIAAELHDNVNQLLTTAKLMQQASIDMPDLQQQCLQKSNKAIDRAIAEIRQLSHRLMVPSFEQNEFSNTIAELMNDLSVSSGVATRLELDKEMELLGNEMKLTLYRIIQEQVTNIQKYAKASQVTLSLKKQDSRIALLIKDDGQGFDTANKKAGIGLNNIENRLAFHEGNMFITSAPQQGCTLEVHIPC